MTDANGFAIATAADISGPRFRRARAEKPNPCNELRWERRGGDQARGADAAASRHRPLSRYDTDGREPLWNGPSLNAAFAAQLIGQVLDTATAPDQRSALAAYRGRAGCTRAFDRSP